MKRPDFDHPFWSVAAMLVGAVAGVLVFMLV
jgi:demethoxyubiquinone hydroxylase (CLK1/Coq7/Cat5 family)